MSKETFMQHAINLAEKNIKNGGGPFGAIIVKNNQVIATGVNSVTSNNDPTAHAEILAIREASQKLNTFNLEGCEIYTSCEPCPMCFSAIYWAHLDKVYFAATHSDAEKAGFDDAFIYKEIKQPLLARTIPFKKIEIDSSIRPFNTWINHDEKTLY